jgi:hypothetical protein
MIKQSSQNKDGRPSVERREFLIKGAAGAVGALMLTSSSSRLALASPVPSAILDSYFLRLTQQFASNVGFSLRQESAANYLEQAYGTQSDPWRQYQRPLEWNYSYQSAWGYYWSQRYYNARPSYMLYPWVRSENGLLTFQGLANRNYYASYLAAPSIWGLNRASIYITKRQIMRTTYEISQALLPQCDCQSSWSQGRFQDSYRQPDTYTSFDGSRVSIDYQRVTNDRGEVRVEYQNPRNGDHDFEFIEAVPLSGS